MSIRLIRLAVSADSRNRVKLAKRATPMTSTDKAAGAGATATKAAGAGSGAVDKVGDENPADLKIILLGDSAVGKSKLVERFLMDDYVPRQLSTYALTVFRHTGTVKEAKKEEGRKVVIDFWDTAGQERFNSMHPSYYHRAHACILVFDVTRKVTYKNLDEWMKELVEYRKRMPVLVVANKIDVDYEVTKKQFAFPSKFTPPLPFHFCSAADGTNVVKCFQDAIEAAWEYKQNPSGDFMEEVLREVDYFDAKEKAEKDKAKEISIEEKKS